MKKTVLPIALLLSACANQPAPTRDAEITPPSQWQQTNAAGASQTDAVSSTWWKSFGSTELDALIERAHNDSYDIAAAIARVQQARAQAGIAGAALWPQLDARVDAARDKQLHDERATSGRYEAGLQAQYELDFWGRQRAVRDAAAAGLRASEFDRDTVRLSVTSAVASTWLQSVGLRESRAIAALNLANAERILQIVESRYRAGAATPFDLAVQRGLVASQRRQQVVIEQQLADSDIALAALLGKPVSEVAVATPSLTPLQSPAIAAGVPSALLVRRPDIASAEARLAAASADVSAARAAMLPQITLVAGIGVASTHGDTLFDEPLATLSAGLVAPLFNGGRLSAQRDLALARQQELVATYRAAIINAFADTETALNAIAYLDRQQAVQLEELTQARNAADIAEARYRAGAEDLLEVLDAQRTLYAAQDQQVILRTARLQASVGLYRALGGGWELPASDAD